MKKRGELRYFFLCVLIFLMLPVSFAFLDSDYDLVLDSNDECTLTATGAFVDLRGCSCDQKTCDIGDICCDCNNRVECSPDTDNDAVCDACDNCPRTYNPLQDDMDSDYMGDECDVDKDGDDFTADEGDLIDDNPDQNPLMPEKCNDIDDNANGYIDDGCDDDSDGYCDNSMDIVGNPVICVNGGDDCNDISYNIHPGGIELCNNIDDNCDGTIDESCIDDTPSDFDYDEVYQGVSCYDIACSSGEYCRDGTCTSDPYLPGDLDLNGILNDTDLILLTRELFVTNLSTILPFDMFDINENNNFDIMDIITLDDMITDEDAIIITGNAVIRYNLSSLQCIPHSGDIAPRYDDFSPNPDGEVDIHDAIVALRMSVREITPTEPDLVCGDVTPYDAPDGKISFSDVSYLLKHAADVTEDEISEAVCGDNICQITENYDACSIDCVNVFDGICPGGNFPCDPDCENYNISICKKSPETKKERAPFPWMIFLFGTIVIALILLVVWLLYRQHETLEKDENLRLKEYITVNLERGVKKSQIGLELIKDGWSPRLVKEALSEVQEPTHLSKMQNIELQSYIMSASERGYSKPAIISELKKAGWNTKQIEEAYSELKPPKLTKEQLIELQNYIMNASQRHYTKKQIVQELLHDGWTQSQIDTAFHNLRFK